MDSARILRRLVLHVAAFAVVAFAVIAAAASAGIRSMGEPDPSLPQRDHAPSRLVAASLTPAASPTPSPMPSPEPSVGDSQWVINGATVKAGGALATEVDSGGAVYAGSVAAARGTWTVKFRFSGQTPVPAEGTVTGPGPVIDATIDVLGQSIELHGTPGKDLSVSVGKRDNRNASETLAFTGGRAAPTVVRAPRTTEAEVRDAAAGMGLDWIRAVIAFTVVGWLVLLIAPGLRGRGFAAAQSSPLSRLAVGALVALDLPLASLLVLLVGLPFGLWWIGLVGLAAFVALAIAGYAFSGFVIGALVFSLIGRYRPAWLLIVAAGVALLALASVIPYVGGFISLLAILYGIGSMLYVPRRVVPLPAPEQELDRRPALDKPASAGRPLVE